MAYTAIGQIHRIGQTETINTQRGTQFTKRELVLMQIIYDQYTGQEKSRNYIQVEFGGNGCQLLDGFQAGALVQVTFDVRGSQFTNKEGKEAYITRLNGYRIEAYVPRQYAAAPQPVQQPVQQPQPAYQQQRVAQPYPQQSYQQADAFANPNPVEYTPY